MKKYWTKSELDNQWILSDEELSCINSKAKLHRLTYAIKMRFFSIYGYFPESTSDISYDVICFIASQINNIATLLKKDNWRSRSSQLHNNEIREFYGYKKFNSSYWSDIEKYLKTNSFIQAESNAQIEQAVYIYLKEKKIEPPAKSIIIRTIRSLQIKFEAEFFAGCAGYISNKGKRSIRKIIKYQNEETILSILRKNPGKVSDKTISEEIKKIELLGDTGLIYNKFFDSISPPLLQKYHDKVSLMTPSALNKLYTKNENKFYTILGCFVKYKATRTIDNCAELFIRRYHRIETKAKSNAKTEIVNYYTKSDKEKLLYNIVDISLKYPKDAIEDKIYTGVGGKEILESCKASKASFKSRHKRLEYQYMSSLYTYHHRKYIFSILESIKLHSSNCNAQLSVINYILKHSQDEGYNVLEFIKNNTKKTLLPALDLKTIKEEKDKKICNTYTELALLSKLKKDLRCKNIWIKGSYKYSDPDQDIPKNCNQKIQHHCNTLGISDNPHTVALSLKKEMNTWMQKLNDNLPQNEDIRIGTKGKSNKSHVYITPYEAQEEPENLTLLKSDIISTWPGLGLLDILKEADLRVGLTSELIDLYGKTSLDKTNLRQRLLMCLFATGTNTEFNKVCNGSDISAEDLRYTKKRAFSPIALRHVIRKLVNSTLEIRDPNIWGDLTNSFASDSTKVASWSDNLMTEYHIRYGGSGIMAYWHVEKKALCIASQTIKCSDSEVAAMLRGIIHHATNAKVEKHSTDTHGQSLVAFAFSYVLGIDLRPRIKGIGKLKLYKADSYITKSFYPNIKQIITRSIKWDYFYSEYHSILKCAIALKSKTTDPEVILKRFISDNLQSPLYKAILELGRAVRTIYMCKYLLFKELRIEIDESLNVVENWHSCNDFIFFGKRGIISSNNIIDQELSILSLHLLQSSLVYINTLMIQQILKKKEWVDKLTLEDIRALTPLFYKHINQYGLFKLDMNKRVNIEGM